MIFSKIYCIQSENNLKKSQVPLQTNLRDEKKSWGLSLAFSVDLFVAAMVKI